MTVLARSAAGVGLSLLLAVNVVGCQSCSSFVAWFRWPSPFLLLLLLPPSSLLLLLLLHLSLLLLFSPAARCPLPLCVCVCCTSLLSPRPPLSSPLHDQLLRFCSNEAAAANVPRTRVSAPSLSQCHSRVRVSASSSLYVYILRRASGCVCARVCGVRARVLKPAGSMGREKRCILSGAT